MMYIIYDTDPSYYRAGNLCTPLFSYIKEALINSKNFFSQGVIPG